MLSAKGLARKNACQDEFAENAEKMGNNVGAPAAHLASVEA